MYSIFEQLMNAKGLKIADVSRATGISMSTFTDWRAGRYTPKADKIAKIAEFFSVSSEYLMTGKHPEHKSNSGKTYYFSDETAKIAQELFENPKLHALFDAACDLDETKLTLFEKMAYEMKGTNQDG